MTSLDHDVPPLTLSSVSPQEERDPFFELVDSFARRTHELKCLSTLHKHQRQFDAAEYQHQLHGLHEQLSEVERLLTNVRMYIELESQFVPLAKVRRTCVSVTHRIEIDRTNHDDDDNRSRCSSCTAIARACSERSSNSHQQYESKCRHRRCADSSSTWNMCRAMQAAR